MGLGDVSVHARRKTCHPSGNEMQLERIQRTGRGRRPATVDGVEALGGPQQLRYCSQGHCAARVASTRSPPQERLLQRLRLAAVGQRQPNRRRLIPRRDPGRIGQGAEYADRGKRSSQQGPALHLMHLGTCRTRSRVRSSRDHADQTPSARAGAMSRRHCASGSMCVRMTSGHANLAAVCRACRRIRAASWGAAFISSSRRTRSPDSLPWTEIASNPDVA